MTGDQDHDDRDRRVAVNVSYGERLAEYPMISTALLWLEWVQRGLDSREVGALLRSPFAATGSPGERHRLVADERRLLPAVPVLGMTWAW